MMDLLRELCACDGVSGLEDEVRGYIEARLKPHADEMRVDNMGNLLVFKKGKKNIGKTVMLCAHMDEVGMIVKDITEDGYLKFDFIGGIDKRVVIGKRVKAGPGKLPGIIAIKAYHLVDKAEEKKVNKVDDLYIDIGAGAREEAQKLVGIGDVVSFESDFVEFGDGFVKAKAIDDRLGCALMIKLIEEAPAIDTWFAFTVQEEVGLRGSSCASFEINPEIAVIIEATTAADLPSMDNHRKTCSPGKGAVLPFMDNSAIYDRGMLADLRRIADENGIKWQHKTLVAGGTDAGAVQKMRDGARVCAISAAVRYIHSPVCVAHAPDFDEMLKLTRLYLEHLAASH